MKMLKKWKLLPEFIFVAAWLSTLSEEDRAVYKKEQHASITFYRID